MKRRKGPPPRNLDALCEGRIIGRLGPVFTVEHADGDIECLARGKTKTAVVGDRVFFDPDAGTELGEGLLISIKSRDNCLKRTDALGRKAQFIAANLSQIIVVCAAEPPLREGLIDRYLIAARMEGIKATILFNKVDLLTEEALTEYQVRLRHYPEVDHSVIYASCETESGLDTLRQALKDEVSILVGHSGVGKTSLINCLLPNYDGRTNVLSSSTNKGQHTTTASWLHRIPTGGELIDTPGIRSFGLYGVSRQTLATHFPDFDIVEGRCHFNDCTHAHEPKCAVLEMVKAGRISATRHAAYLNLLDSADDLS